MLFGSRNEKNFIEAKRKLRAELLQQGIPHNEIDSIIENLQDEKKNVPLPKIAFIGFTGVGKSTTLNALFNAGRETSAVRACTQKEAPIIGNVEKFTGSKGSVIIYDMPGLGEDVYKDQQHFETYRKVLPVVDVVVWMFHTGDRAMTPMQEALAGLIKYLGSDFSNKLMFAINKADAIAPGESAWNQKLNAPSQEQRRNITDLESYVREKIRQIMPHWNGPLVTYSARTRFRLEQLMTAMIETMPKDRRWVLDSMADVADPTEFMDEALLNYVRTQQKR